ncbi:cobalamin B12-binding domain-containing protein [bacterium]|nr:cobalamin B12-binding domain-containing protein [bacterium]
MNNKKVSLPYLSADLLLLHAPAFFDFRKRRDIYFPFPGTSGDVPITPLYEHFPIGFKTLQRYLSDHGHDVKLINLCTVLLRYPKAYFDALIEAFDVKLIGIDLHWIVHVQGSLAVAERIKKLRTEVPVIFGGISSTYYANQLIQYSFIDMVMQGYDTHKPTASLLEAIKQGGNLRAIPNLLWKSRDGQIHDNGFSYKPDTFGCGIDWSNQPQETNTQTLPVREFLTVQNAGCSYNCHWCGGSREAFRRIFKRKRAMARKPPSEICYEFDTMSKLPSVDQYHLYSIGTFNESKEGMEFLLNRVGESNFKSITYEQFYLTPDDILKRMVQENEHTIISLSPQSHDLKVAKLAGHGVYSNEELERWLEKAIDYGIYQINIWYCIGMPEQGERSVMETVDYCQQLLEMFKGKRVLPIVCPMIPFLDPASTFFEYPDKYGYRVVYRTVEEHRRGMEHASIINRINYETKWLSRSDLAYVGLKAVRRLMEAKAEAGLLPLSWAKDYNAKIDDALDFIGVVHEADCIVDEKERAQELEKLGDDIARRNDRIFFSGVMNQVFPINRQIGGRWFDELGWESQVLDAVLGG